MVLSINNFNTLNKVHFGFKRINLCQIQKFCSFNNENFKYPTKQIEICTLKNFYNKPNYKFKNGLNFKVEYCDTQSMLSNPDKAPVVLAIHGAPGSHNDFASYVKFLTLKMGARVIIPNFPDFKATDFYELFLHSAQEKAIYLNDFLKSINLNSLDMLITHSSGIYPPLHLWNGLRDLPDNHLQNIGSFVFFSPPGFTRIKAMKPKWYVDNMASIYSDVIGRKILRKIGYGLLKISRTSVKIDNIDNVFIACITMKNSQNGNLYSNLIALRNFNKPVLLVFGERDKLIENENFYNLCKLFELDEKEIIKLEKNGQIINNSLQNSLYKAISIKDAGHYCLKTHSNFLENYIQDTLLQALKLKKSINVHNGFEDLNKFIELEKNAIRI